MSDDQHALIALLARSGAPPRPPHQAARRATPMRADAPRGLPGAQGDGKPVAVLGASVGTLGPARPQYHLRQVLRSERRTDTDRKNRYSRWQMGTRPWFGTPLSVSGAHQVFDVSGALLDEQIRERLQISMTGCVAFVQQRS